MTETINHPNVKHYPLHRACQNGRQSMTTINFLFGEDDIQEKINEKDDIDCTPLMYAAEYGHTDLVVKLIEQGADFNAFDKHGRTAYWYAADGGHFDVIKTFLKNGFYFINKKGDINDETAIDRAACHGHWDTVEHMIEEIPNLDIKNCDRDGETVLTMAAFAGKLDIVKKLVYKDADINNRCKRGLSPLLKAIQGKHGDVVEYLLRNGADVKNTCASGETAAEKASNVNFFDEFATIYEKVFDQSFTEKGEDHDPTPEGLGLYTNETPYKKKDIVMKSKNKKNKNKKNSMGRTKNMNIQGSTLVRNSKGRY